MGSVEWENGYQRDSPRGHFWRRMREAMSGVAGCKDFAVVEKMMMRRKKKKKKTKRAPQRQRRLSKFQYDPWSYALNFDEGSDGNSLGMLGSHGGGGGGASDVVLVYVLWVRTK